MKILGYDCISGIYGYTIWVIGFLELLSFVNGF